MARVREILLPWDSQPQEVVKLDADDSLSQDLSGFWLLNGDGRDISGNDNHLDLIGAPPFVPVGGGISGIAPSTSTSNTLYRSDVKNSPNGISAASMACWIYMPTGSSDGCPFNYPATGIDGELGFYCPSVTGIRFDAVSVPSTTTVPSIADAWHHIAVTYDGATRRGYLDGVQVHSAAVTGAIASSVNQINVGRFSSGATNHFTGKVSNARMYRRGLTAAEIQRLVDTPYAGIAPQSIQVPVSAGGGPTPITATLAQTLADATSSATGTLALSGATAATLDSATLASAATLALTGTTTATLADATLAATGTLAVTTSGALAQTLADATVTATAALAIKGTTTQTLANATASASSTLAIKGTTTATLAGATLDAQGTAQAVTVGTLSATLADATVAATAKLAIAVVASPTLADAILAATATMPLAGLSGIVTQTLQDATSAATGTVLIKGSATVTLDACTLVAAGAEGVIVPVVLGSLVGSTRKTASGRPAAVSSYARSNRQNFRR